MQKATRTSEHTLSLKRPGKSSFWPLLQARRRREGHQGVSPEHRHLILREQTQNGQKRKSNRLLSNPRTGAKFRGNRGK